MQRHKKERDKWKDREKVVEEKDCPFTEAPGAGAGPDVAYRLACLSCVTSPSTRCTSVVTRCSQQNLAATTEGCSLALTSHLFTVCPCWLLNCAQPGELRT